MSKLGELSAVNETINRLPYKAEVGDDWTPGKTEADCDSYATAKFETLVHIGWSRSALRLATCWVETGEYHAVLLVDLDGQTWVLDNRQTRPLEKQLLPYKWHKLQVAGTKEWEYA